jgi:hypothetical protein
MVVESAHSLSKEIKNNNRLSEHISCLVENLIVHENWLIVALQKGWG